jgi:ABC-type uncharacterized transport system permease subunit
MMRFYEHVVPRDFVFILLSYVCIFLFCFNFDTQVVKVYDADAITLYVRVSNDAAINLYRDKLGYSISDTVSSYYADGEDAYKMILMF